MKEDPDMVTSRAFLAAFVLLGLSAVPALAAEEEEAQTMPKVDALMLDGRTGPTLPKPQAYVPQNNQSNLGFIRQRASRGGAAAETTKPARRTAPRKTPRLRRVQPIPGRALTVKPKLIILDE